MSYIAHDGGRGVEMSVIDCERMVNTMVSGLGGIKHICHVWDFFYSSKGYHLTACTSTPVTDSLTQPSCHLDIIVFFRWVDIYLNIGQSIHPSSWFHIQSRETLLFPDSDLKSIRNGVWITLYPNIHSITCSLILTKTELEYLQVFEVYIPSSLTICTIIFKRFK